MLKLLAIILIIIVVGVLVWLFWFQKPKKVNSDPIQDTLGEVSKTYENSVSDIKNNVEETSKKTISDAKETIYDKAQEVLSAVFEKKPTLSQQTNNQDNINVIIESSPQPGNIFFEFDLSKGTNSKIKLTKNTKYQLKFQNVPKSYCLYIGDKKYELENNQILEIQFNSQGNYTLKTNSCNLDEKNIGEIIVE